jgi:hypothetical protein
MKSARSWRWLFWVILLLGLIKFYLCLFAGAIMLVWIAQWLLWVMLVGWILAMWALWQILYIGLPWSSIIRWILLIFICALIGASTKSLRWTGDWQWSSSDGGASNAPVVGTTDVGENLVACETDANASVVPAPAGITVAMFSTNYVARADGKAPDYTETTGYNVKEFSYERMNVNHPDSSVPYTAAEIPEGDVFFTVRGEGGFSAGYDFEMQVCSTDGKMLSKEALNSGTPRDSDSASNVTGIIQYLWRNRRVWGPGEYRSYGYMFDKDNQWKLIAKSEPYTIK